MNREIRICVKIIVIIAATILFMAVIKKDILQRNKAQPVGEYIKKEDVRILTDIVLSLSDLESDLFSEPSIRKDQSLSDNNLDIDSEENLTYGDYISILELIEPKKGKYEEFRYDDKYQEEFYLLRDDFYAFFDVWLNDLGMENKIYKEKVSILCRKDMTDDRAGASAMITADGKEYRYHSAEIGELAFTDVSLYVLEKEGEKEYLTIHKIEKTSFTLPFLWLMKKEDDQLTFFWQNHEITYQQNGKDFMLENGSDRVASLTFSQGSLTSGEYHTEKVSGKLLRRTEKELEIEGVGVVPLHSDVRIYKLHGNLETGAVNDLTIGYEFADFVLDNGKLCAVLLTAEANMDKIRVAMKSNQFSSLYHDTITFSCDSDGMFYYGTYEEPQELFLPAGEMLVIGKEKEYQDSERMQFIPKAHSGRITIHELERSKMPVTIRGKLDILYKEEGYVLINELYLEEYLYSVVPSEMPASYPHEALKAQAVAARTYAYQYLKNPGYPDLGAHVDDSVSYQVYNNIEEHPASTKAVKETKGEMLFYGDDSLTPYYYSTSCGLGTDAAVWGEENQDKFPYLTASVIGERNQKSAEEFQEEENFREWILSENENDFEYELPWYRWTYEVEDLSVEGVYERLSERFAASPHQILTKQEDGTFQSTKPEKFRQIYEIKPAKRNSGGVLHELIIGTDNGTYQVITEYNIRYVLSAGGEIRLKNGKTSPCSLLLPSAYFVIEESKDGDEVTGYKLFGGGYGHGVGMSQNAAAQMARKGYTYTDILLFFYKESIIKQLYE